MGNVEVAYSLTDDFHNKHLQCSDIRGYYIENGSVRRFVAQNPGGGGVLPYITDTGMCRPKGAGF